MTKNINVEVRRDNRKILARLSLALFTVFIVACSQADEKKSDPNQLFYTANHYYESRDYKKALEAYLAILGAGSESGGVYYNIGNSYLKIGDLGRAILYYEKAKRLIPYDSDLKANLSYARSLVENSPDRQPKNFALNALGNIFESYSLRAIIFSASILYLILILQIGICIARPFLAKKFRVILLLSAALFIVNLTVLADRYFEERILRRGVVVQKEVECKYEPIEESTTYYKLREGGGVLILKTRNGWRHIRRPDGKISWVRKEAVDEI